MIWESARRAERCTPVQLPDLAQERSSHVQKMVLDAGYRSILIVPLLRPKKIVGALVVRRREPGEFDEQVVHLLETFAAQSVLAIQNAKLFREIEEKGRELEAASRHKSQFLANMSHELRTPLNSVLGFTELLVDGIYGELPDKAKTTIARVQANGRHLLGLINDVLDLSKIEAGQLTLALDDYSVGQIVRLTVTAVEPLARAKGLALGTNVAENLPIGRGDERRLTQVLLNLAGNAVKFTETGAVDIVADAVDGHFEIAVRDTGPGIARQRPGSHLRRIPAGRQQQHQAEGRNRPRPGYLQAHRRNAWRNNRCGIRARVGLDVPHEDTDPGGRGREGRMSKRILMIEDTEDNRQIVRDLIATTDYELIEAADGAAGVAAAAADKPDLILMDIQLPVIDGYEAARRIKADPALRHIPIIAVTSYALVGR